MKSVELLFQAVWHFFITISQIDFLTDKLWTLLDMKEFT